MFVALQKQYCCAGEKLTAEEIQAMIDEADIGRSPYSTFLLFPPVWIGDLGKIQNWDGLDLTITILYFLAL
jgi:hypothetical protein